MLPPLVRPYSVAALMLITTSAAAAAGPPAIPDARVRARRAVEQVYWSHRTWPADNATQKPRLEEVLPDGALRARIEETSRKAAALASLRGRPLSATELQAELDRMAASSRAPEVLQEIFDQVGDDPALVVDALVRPTLVDRLLREAYARDRARHAAVKAAAEAILAKARTPEDLAASGADYRVTRYRHAEGPVAPGSSVVVLDGEGWDEMVRDLSRRVDRPFDPGTTGIGPLVEDDDGFSATVILDRGADTITVGTATWPKTSFDAWWSRSRDGFPAGAAMEEGTFELPRVGGSPCIVGSWTPTCCSGYPVGRGYASTVWTGSEMLVWGGNTLAPGARYVPASDTWAAINSTGQPAGRNLASAVWTGSRMVVWGGQTNSGTLDYLNTGGRYDPTTDSWQATSTAAGVPAGRSSHTAIWTGSRMVVWGGNNSLGDLNTGGRYDPVADSWTATAATGQTPAARHDHTAVWTGTVMIVWGGDSSATGFLDSGGRYDPAANSWTGMATSQAPSARSLHSAVWTGTQMIVWGGEGSSNPAETNTGGRYDPATNKWSHMSSGTGVPSARFLHFAFWTGTRMLIWGGIAANVDLATGGSYDPQADAWSSPSSAGAPEARHSAVAVWTGSLLIEWGGAADRGGGITEYLDTGGRYDPAANSWTPTATNLAKPARVGHTSVWTGAEMIVFGGDLPTGIWYAHPRRYDPATDTWAAASTTGAPSPRTLHTAVWTGSQMIVWGGTGPGGVSGDGARYDPTLDAWSAVTATGAPSARGSHVAVWTGTEMIIWGAAADSSGGRYNPSSDTWTPTGGGANLPSSTVSTAVWTGSEMIVWGSSSGPTGGRYRPSTDSWRPMNLGSPGVPGPRSQQVAVWTGKKMVVWGGFAPPNPSPTNTGAAYDPVLNSWTATSIGPGVPSARGGSSAAWTGTEMIVWGGAFNATPFGDGGRYDPTADTWTAIPAGGGSPAARAAHTTVWTGDRAIVWGGQDGGQGLIFDSGASYCVASCANPTTWHPDGDGDGFGAVGVNVPACAQPPGYVVDATDCDDLSAAAFPGGGPELCDKLDNDCNGLVDEGFGPPGQSQLSLSHVGTTTTLSWVSGGGAIFDVVTGSLTTLRSTGGSWIFATNGCLANDTTATSLVVATSDSPSEALWYLIREKGCTAGFATYDDPSDPSQVVGRDDGISASGRGCP